MGRRQGRSDPIAKDLSLLSPEVLGTLPAPLPAAKRGGKKKPPPAYRPFSRHGRRDFPASWHLRQRLMHFGRGLVEGTAVVPPPVTAGSPKAALRPTLPLLPQGSAEAPQGLRRRMEPARLHTAGLGDAAPSLDPALLPKARLSPDLYEAAPSLAYSYYPYIPAYYSRVKGQALL